MQIKLTGRCFAVIKQLQAVHESCEMNSPVCAVLCNIFPSNKNLHNRENIFQRDTTAPVCFMFIMRTCFSSSAQVQKVNTEEASAKPQQQHASVISANEPFMGSEMVYDAKSCAHYRL